MDVNRAKQISESPVMAHVTHNGQQVYIQSVDEESEMARIYHLKNPEQEHDVHVSNLTERTTQ
ncbi:H-type small acid-soluble spore protein [Alicyclobacillus acidiphilus]|jgi:small acid-soluble spore protein H (minor)|uniref:H-type small acid-soluble spore protein n=1 Tax=Alicyclobacillus acidiphilus TaxID=182455 RepID=UPI00082E4124|nr:H-type small acid-soluble spore protein [Alicyclobacillus acidiphilus]